jgi:hypothetical protein
MSRPAHIPADWKQFTLANGERKWLPDWADKPLKFEGKPDRRLRAGAYHRPRKSQKTAS